MRKIRVPFAYAAGGLTQTAPEGLVPLDSLPSPAGGTREGYIRSAMLLRPAVLLAGRRGRLRRLLLHV